MLKPNMLEAKKRSKNSFDFENFKLDKEYQNIGVGLTYCVKTYGCQMNEHDSENIKAILETMSFTELDDYEKADLVILNTCAIRENAHNKVFGLLGRLKHLKEERPSLMVGFCGCMAQEESVINELSEKYKWVDIIFGTHNIHELPKVLAKSIKEKVQDIEVYSIEGNVVEQMPVKRASKYKAWVNIMYGCDKFCTYCIVPYTRGKQRSRKKEDIIVEVEELVKNGYQEVTLLGQNVNAYGKDLYDDYDMASLLEDTAKTGIARIRFVTSHPWDFNSKMIDVIAKYDNIMPYIHLPLQSGSNRVLKLMGIRYTKESYLALFDELKAKIPNVSITTDIIVGFPNETEEQFQNTLKLVREVGFEGAFTFIYSPREGTPAAKMKDNVSLEEKHDRLNRLIELTNQGYLKGHQRFVGQTVEVLVDEESKNGDGMMCGYSKHLKLTHFKSNDKSLIGKIVKVKVTEAKTWFMIGDLVED